MMFLYPDVAQVYIRSCVMLYMLQVHSCIAQVCPALLVVADIYHVRKVHLNFSDIPLTFAVYTVHYVGYAYIRMLYLEAIAQICTVVQLTCHTGLHM